MLGWYHDLSDLQDSSMIAGLAKKIAEEIAN